MRKYNPPLSLLFSISYTVELFFLTPVSFRGTMFLQVGSAPTER